MNPTKTQQRVNRRLSLKYGSTLTFERTGPDDEPVEYKALPVENPTELPFRWRVDAYDMPNQTATSFLAPIPPEPLRDVDNNPVDANGDPLDIPQPDMTRTEYVRCLFAAGRSFDCAGVRYTVKREVPLLVADVMLYLLFICDHN